MFKCIYKNLSLLFYELHNFDKDSLPKEDEFCLLQLKDGSYTAGRWWPEEDDAMEDPAGEFNRGQFDSISAEEVSKWYSLNYNLSTNLENEELENLHFRNNKEETLTFTLKDFRSLKDQDFPEKCQYCLLILTDGRIAGGRWDYWKDEHDGDFNYASAGASYSIDQVWAWTPLGSDEIFAREEKAERERKFEEELNKNPSVDHNRFIYGTDVNIYYEKALEKLRKEYPWASLAQMKKIKPWMIVPLHGQYVFGQEERSYDGTRIVREWTDGSTADEFIDFLCEYTKNTVENSNPEEKFKFGTDIEVYLEKVYENVKKDYRWFDKGMIKNLWRYTIKQIDGDWEFVREYDNGSSDSVLDYSSAERFIEGIEDEYRQAALDANPVVSSYEVPFSGVDCCGWNLEKYIVSKLGSGDYKVFVQAGNRSTGGSREFFITPYCFEAESYEEFLERYLKIVPGSHFGLSKKDLIHDEGLKNFLGY